MFSADEKRLIRSAYELKSQDPLPKGLEASINASMDQAASSSVGAEQKNRSWRYLVGVAACVVVSASVGLIVANSNQVSESSSSPVVLADNSLLKDGDPHDAWVQRVVDYQSLYTANTVTSKASMSEAEALKLIDSMGIAQGSITKLPSFDQAGYRFARAQQLGFNGQPLVQLVYTKAGETPLAFCFMPVGESSPRDLALSREYDLGVASWVGDQFHYVLVADEAEAVLQQLYDEAFSVVGQS